MSDAVDRAERLERLQRRRPVVHGVMPAGEVRVSANVCEAAGCLSLGSDRLVDALVEQVAGRRLDDVAVRRVGCLGPCASGPIVDVPEHGRLFEAVTPSTIDAIVEELASAKAHEERPATPPFFAHQHKVVLENCGRIDPENIDEYLARSGYSALTTAVTSMSPIDVIEEVARSGLRGRGGAGYPTGLKWRTVAKASGDPKFVICNADEGDPGAFMDRSVLESDPQRVLEGMAIAGYAIGAGQGYIYVRAEYPLAVKRLKTAIGQAERHNLLASNIADSTFSFHVDLRVGAGAFVCGEETALLASVQGQRGTPRPRPPYPAVSGLWGQPTLINNVETFANVPPIIRNGAAWYSAIGTDGSKGTKVFALAGRIARSGLVEVPMGTSLRDIVYGIGGGVIDGGELKAVQTGGPSGGCIPAEHADLAVDYESLAEVGSIMGSGGMIVMDQTSCMVDVAKYFMGFCRDESCGKCVPCRVGTVQLFNLLDAITLGRGTRADLGTLERLARMITDTSLCGLGQTAANPLSSTLRYFRDEYIAHIDDRVCPAGRCTMSSEAE